MKYLVASQDIDGLTVQLGETYLQDTPFHTGGAPAKTVEEQFVLINLLKEEFAPK